MKLTFVVSSHGPGGAEHVMTAMANHWTERGWHITLLTFPDGREPFYYKLAPGVVHRGLDLLRPSRNPLAALAHNARSILILRKAIARGAPDAVISFVDRVNVLTLMATSGLSIPVIVSERIDPAHHAIGPVWSWLRERFYARAALVVAQTEAALDYFPAAIRRHGRVIPNPVLPPPADEASGEASARGARKMVIAVGRLVHQKGFDTLLKAFAIVAPGAPDWSLTICGEGELRASLERLRDRLGLGGRVEMGGVVADPGRRTREADLFVLSSRFEGFPNSLCDAMARGLPVIATDCPSGPSAIIRDGVDGLLVPPDDVDALAAAMDRLISDENERDRLAARAPGVMERFALEKVMALWDEAIERVVGPEDIKR